MHLGGSTEEKKEMQLSNCKNNYGVWMKFNVKRSC